MIGGMTARRWWLAQTTDTKRRFADAARAYRQAIGMTAATGLGLIGIFLSHCMELDPWTHLWRLFIISDQIIDEIADQEVSIILSSMDKCCLLSTEHSIYKRVAGVTSRLLEANSNVSEIRKRKWSLVVLDNPKLNAFVMPNGFVFVSTGLATMVNDDQLSIIIGHELAHCMLRHMNNYNSVILAVRVLCLLPIAAVLSTTLPLSQALLAVMMCQFVLHVGVKLTKQRSHETEADRVGFELAANACVDVTQGYQFWESISVLNGPPKQFWWMQTHPTDKSRAQHLYNLIPVAKKLQKLAGC
ncbi:metalloendopeptidase OMA1, mitochondrial-like [Melanaphis sacchari]|uniref:metalloendopeptidase OMA1, mitochondrial-like n=1 Tax=Melanaphis sacchari TaxID=742174 RepID=UPI000DC14D7C|nr:metalloendopeptidase OMA1, mitochondrial-like [Melanaphis sacchari]